MSNLSGIQPHTTHLPHGYPPYGPPQVPVSRNASYPGQFTAVLPGDVHQSWQQPPLQQPGNGHSGFPGPFTTDQSRVSRLHDPPSFLPTRSLTSPGSVTSTSTPTPGLTREDQMEKVTTSFKGKNKKIGVFYDRQQKKSADQIVSWLNELLSGGVCIVHGFEILPQTSDWLQRALTGGVDYFIFVGLPPSVTTSPTPKPQQQQYISEADYFDVKKYVQRVAEVVVVFPTLNEVRYSRAPHYLDRFLRLEGDDMKKVAEDALSLFAGKEE